MLIGNLDFAQMRKNMKITQAEMAGLLGVAQSQVSRWEENPGMAPAHIVDKWCRVCGEIAADEGMKTDSSLREELSADVHLLERYVEASNLAQKAPSPDELPAQLASVDDLLRHIQSLARKPRIGVCGRFDQGKSRLINTLLGKDVLPTGYQPETSLICLIRHISDRPEWMKNDPESMNQEVFIMKRKARVENGLKEFDFDSLEDETYFQSFRCMSGGRDALKDFGTHSGRRADDAVKQDMFAALVFVDSPLLMSCEVLDFPGYSNTEEDSQKVEFAKGKGMIDILVYASASLQFMDAFDLQYLNSLLKKLPPIESEGTPHLRNAFVVATRAGIINDTSELVRILDKAGERSYEFLEGSLRNIREDGVPQDAFRSRFFTFDAERSEFRKDFESELKELLGRVYPSLHRRRVDHAIAGARGKGVKQLVAYSGHIDGLLSGATTAKRELEKLENSEPERKVERDGKAEDVRCKIAEFRKDTSAFIRKELAPKCSSREIENLIGRKGWKRKEAQEECGSYLVNDLQVRLDRFVTEKAEELSASIDELHEFYGQRDGATSVDFLFDSRAAFLAGLAGAGTYGALSVWAAAVAAGSNLGAYILSAKVVSALSAMGISLGGTAAVNSALAAIGGPVTVMIALAMVVAGIVWVIFGESWEERLAQKLAKQLKEDNIIQKIVENAESYWDDTRKGFDTGFAKTEKAYRKHLEKLRRQVDDVDEDALRKQQEYITLLRNCLEGLPWRGAPEADPSL